MNRKNRGRLPPGKNLDQQPAAPDQPVAITVFKAQGYSGPIPPPEMLARYNDAFPGCAEKIVAMAEGQAKHRQNLESRAILGKIKSEARGQWLGVIVVLACVASGVYLTLHDK